MPFVIMKSDRKGSWLMIFINYLTSMLLSEPE